MFDAELVENVISKLKCGKAAGLDCISAEHLQNCHAILPGILAKLFNTMVSLGYVPMAFGQSFTVPVLKILKIAILCTVSLSLLMTFGGFQ